MPIHASQMYAKNIQNLLALMIDKDGALVLNMDDESWPARSSRTTARCSIRARGPGWDRG